MDRTGKRLAAPGHRKIKVLRDQRRQPQYRCDGGLRRFSRADKYLRDAAREAPLPPRRVSRKGD